MDEIYAVDELAVDEVAASDKPVVAPPRRPRETARLDPVNEKVDEMDGLAPASATRTGNEPARARAYEISSSTELAPRIDYSYCEWHGLRAEIDRWFADDAARALLAALPSQAQVLESPDKAVADAAASGDFKPLLYFALGSYADVRSFPEHLAAVEKHVGRLVTAGVLDIIPIDSENIVEQTLLYVVLAAGSSAAGASAHKNEVVQKLMRSIASKRWYPDADIGRQAMILRVALLATFGGSDAREHAENWANRAYTLGSTDGRNGSLSANGSANGSVNGSVESARANGHANGNGALANGNAYGNAKETNRNGSNGHRNGSNGHRNGNGNGTTDSASLVVTPLDYASFRQTITDRYPAFTPPEPPAKALALATPVYRTPVLPNLATAGVPASIEEACEIFRRRVRATPDIVQLWQEHERFAHGTPLPTFDDMPVSLQRVEQVYRDTLLHVKSFLTVLVNLVLSQGTLGGNAAPSPSMHASVELIRLLLDWYRCSHILKFEFVSALLFDLQFHLVTYKYCASHPMASRILDNPEDPVDEDGFWATAKLYSLGDGLSYEAYGLVPEAVPKPPAPAGLKFGIRLEKFSKTTLDVFIGMMGIVRSMITDKTQRIVMVAELPADWLKPMLQVYNQDLWVQALHIFKAQAPFNGKKWRCLNMELISAIYMHCPSKLNDEWLSGADVTGEIKAATSQEEALRSMIEFHNADEPGTELGTEASLDDSQQAQLNGRGLSTSFFYDLH